jgi:hypothetical protein
MQSIHIKHASTSKSSTDSIMVVDFCKSIQSFFHNQSSNSLALLPSGTSETTSTPSHYFAPITAFLISVTTAKVFSIASIKRAMNIAIHRSSNL